MRKYENFCAALDNLMDIGHYHEPYDNVYCTPLIFAVNTTKDRQPYMFTLDRFLNSGGLEYDNDRVGRAV